MRRRTVHVLFAAGALACGGLALYNGLRLQQAQRVNQAILQAHQAQTLNVELPQARFAAAAAWAEQGELEAALNAYKELTQQAEAPVRIGALYNLGNLHLREALQDGADEALRSLPLIELAKQRYREVLRQQPAHWDARFNLEIALTLAPEADDPIVEEDEEPDKENRVISTLPGGQIDLP